MGLCHSADTELIAHLTESPFFCLEHINNRSYLSSLSSKFIKRTYSANDILWNKGEHSSFNIIIEGEVRLQFQEYDDTNNFVIISKTTGQCFGFPEPHKNGTSYKCTAVTDVSVYQLSSDNLQRYWHSNSICYNHFSNNPIVPISSYLQSTNVFESINHHNAQMLAQMFRWKKISKNEILFSEGTIGQEFYIIAKGTVAVVVSIEKSESSNHRYTVNTENPNHKDKEFIVGGHSLHMLDPEQLKTEEMNEDMSAEQKKQLIDNQTDEEILRERIVYEFKSGDYFGEVSLVIKIPRTATIKATEDTTLLELTNSDFQKFIPHQNKIKQSLEKVAHERIAQSFRRYKIPLFNAVPIDKYHILSQLSQIKYFKAGEIVCDPDSDERALYVVAHGNVGVYVTKQRITSNHEDENDEEKTEHLDHSIHAVPNTSMMNLPTNSFGDDIIVPQNTISQHIDVNDEMMRQQSDYTMADRNDRMTLSVDPMPITPMTSVTPHDHHSKKVSQHLLSANFNLLTTMIQREAVNRELIRLSFLSEKASKQAKERDECKLPMSHVTTAAHMISSTPLTEDPTEHRDDSPSPSQPSPIPYTPSGTMDTIKIQKAAYLPITPPPPANSAKIAAVQPIFNESKMSEDNNNSRKNTNSISVVKTLSIKDAVDEVHDIKRETSHGRFHTALGTPSNHEDEKDEDEIVKRRNSDNVTVKFKVSSPKSPGNDRSQLFGYERKQKLVRIADLMLPDDKMDKLRAISRRGSKTSNMGDYPYTSPIPYPPNRNRTISNQSNHISFANIKIDPCNPAVFEDLQFAKNTLYADHRNVHTKNQSVTQSTKIIKSFAKVASNESVLKVPDNGQTNILPMDDYHDDKSKAVHFEDVPDLIEQDAMLRDFKSDGITYTEIEVGVLGSGNFFGETLLIEDEDHGTDSEDDEPTATNTKTANDDNDDSKPKMLDLLNSNSAKKSPDDNGISPSLKKKKSKKMIDADSKSYRGSNTTFKCITNCVIYSITKQSLDEFFRRVPSARAWFDIMLSKYNVSLDTVLHIPRAARYFTLFLESEYAEENVHYVLAVNEYKNAWNNLDNEHRHEMASIICANFIDDEGKQQINVSYSQRKAILERIKIGDIDLEMFDLTQKAIYILLERDCFPRFKQSHFFHEFLNEAENLALLTREQYEEQQKMELEEQMKQN